MPHLTSATATNYHMHGVTFRSYASSSSGATQLAAWSADFEPHTIGQQHSMSHEEVLHVLAGTLVVDIDDEHFCVTSGEAILVPAGTQFTVSNTSDELARAWVTTPLGMTATMSKSDEQILPPWAQ